MAWKKNDGGYNSSSFPRATTRRDNLNAMTRGHDHWHDDDSTTRRQPRCDDNNATDSEPEHEDEGEGRRLE